MLQHEAVSMTEAAPGIEQIDVRAVNAEANRSLYAARIKIHPKRAEGQFRTIKWIDHGGDARHLLPRAVASLGSRALCSQPGRVWSTFASSRFYFFFIEIWPQEFYYITGPARSWRRWRCSSSPRSFGRLWCGYSCPQTVWTDLFIGSSDDSKAIATRACVSTRRPGRLDKIWRKRVAKHLIWLLIAVATGGAWVFYFDDAPTLARQLVAFGRRSRPMSLVGVLTVTTYVLGGLRASRSAPICAPGRASRRAMIDRGLAAHLLSRLARRAAWSSQESGKPGKEGRSASTAINALRSVRWGSTFATGRSSNAFNARSASMLATRSWTRLAGRVG